MRMTAVLLAVTSLSACSSIGTPSANFDDPFPENYKQIVLQGIKDRFFDPYSIRDAAISSPRVGPPFNIGGSEGWVVCFKGNVKNRMGGYIGMRESVFMIRGGKVIDFTEGPEPFYTAPYYCKDVTYEPFSEANMMS